MEKVIGALYEMHMDRRFDKFMEKYREDKEVLFQGYQKLKAQLSAEQAEALGKIMDSQLDQMELELQESFSEGFKLGVKMMCEVFGKDEKSFLPDGKL